MVREIFQHFIARLKKAKGNDKLIYHSIKVMDEVIFKCGQIWLNNYNIFL
jgi:hypothetical protein